MENLKTKRNNKKYDFSILSNYDKRNLIKNFNNIHDSEFLDSFIDYLTNYDLSFLRKINTVKKEIKTICVVNGWPWRSGSAKVCIDLCNKLYKLGYKVIYAVNHPFTDKSYYLDKNINIHIFDSNQNRNVEFIKLLNKYSVDLTIFNQLESATLLKDLALCRILKIKTLIYFHYCFSFFYVTNNLTMFNNLIVEISISNGLIVTNKFDYDLYKLFCSNIYFILHPIDYLKKKIFLPKHNSSNEIVYMARGLDPIKRIDDLVNICLELRKKTTDFKIVVLGNFSNEFLEKIKKHNLVNNFVLAGWQNSVYEYLNNSLVLLSTSITESYGMSIIEAMYFTKPVIMYKIPYLPFYNSKGIYKVNIGDYKGVAKILYELLQNKELAYKKGLVNKKYIDDMYKNYNDDLIWKKIVESKNDKSGYLDYYFDACSGSIAYGDKTSKRLLNLRFVEELKTFVFFIPHTIKRIIRRPINILKRCFKRK